MAGANKKTIGYSCVVLIIRQVTCPASRLAYKPENAMKRLLTQHPRNRAHRQSPILHADFFFNFCLRWRNDILYMANLNALCSLSAANIAEKMRRIAHHKHIAEHAQTPLMVAAHLFGVPKRLKDLGQYIMQSIPVGDQRHWETFI